VPRRNHTLDPRQGRILAYHFSLDPIFLKERTVIPRRFRLWARRALVVAGTLATSLSGILTTPALGAGPPGKLQIYGLRMEPEGNGADRFSRESWGVGGNVVVAIPGTGNLFAATLGGEYVHMLDETTVFQDLTTGLIVEQQTSQDLFRIVLGGRLGPNGPGLIHPFLGTGVAIVGYGISTDVVVPDDDDVENEIRQNLRDEDETVFGWEASLGVDVTIHDSVAIEGGFRYLKSFHLPVQLGAGSVTVEPTYTQFYLGVGITFGAIDRLEEETEDSGEEPDEEEENSDNGESDD
jgi:hypothetical protein